MNKTRTIYIIIPVILLALSTASVFLGATGLSNLILVRSRLPRLMSLLLSGAGISVCGLIMQKISQNRFVSPETAGTMGSAALGFVLALLVFPQGGVLFRIGFSFATAMAGSLLFFFLISRIRNRSLVYVPLMGIILGGIFNGITQIIAHATNLIQVLNLWLFADFSLIIGGRYEVLYLIVPAVLAAYLFAHHLTIAGMGKSFATSLGASYHRSVLLGLLITAITSAVVVVTAGRVPFLGLIVPNVISMNFSDNIKAVLPLTALSGATLLLASDLFGRLVLHPYEIPVGLTMGIIGGLGFIVFIRSQREPGHG